MTVFTFSILCIMIQFLQCKPTKCTHFIIITIVFIIHELLHISGLNGPSTGSAQFYKTIVTPRYHRQYVRKFINVLFIEMDMCTVIGAACRFECVHGDDGQVRPETCRSLCRVKHYCNYNDVCTFCWFTW